MNYKLIASATADAQADMTDTESPKPHGNIFLRAIAAMKPALKVSDHPAKPLGARPEITGVYALNERQYQEFEKCIATERKPGARAKAAVRRYKALVTSR